MGGLRSNREVSSVVELKKAAGSNPDSDSREIIRSKRSKEIFFAVVGPVGAGGSRVISSLKRACQTSKYSCEDIKASDLIRKWADEKKRQTPPSDNKTLDDVVQLQDIGDAMREADSAAVARAVIREIAQRRAQATNQTYSEGTAVHPDDKKTRLFH